MPKRPCGDASFSGKCKQSGQGAPETALVLGGVSQPRWQQVSLPQWSLQMTVPRLASYLQPMRDLASPGGARGTEPTCQCRRRRRRGFDPWIGKIPWRRAWQPTPVFLPGESHGQRSLAGYSPQGSKESDTTLLSE